MSIINYARDFLQGLYDTFVTLNHFVNERFAELGRLSASGELERMDADEVHTDFRITRESREM